MPEKAMVLRPVRIFAHYVVYVSQKDSKLCLALDRLTIRSFCFIDIS